MTYTVVASYREPSQIYCQDVDAESPEAAINEAWNLCRKANWGDAEVSLTEEWSDFMVIEGDIKVVL